MTLLVGKRGPDTPRLMSTDPNAAERTRLKKKKEKKPGGGGGFDMGSLMQISEDDVKEEVGLVQRTRERLIKTNERLAEDLQKALAEHEKWEEQLIDLDKKLNSGLVEQEDKLEQAKFEWQREKKTIKSEFEKANSKLASMEDELDDREEKSERERERELENLKEELSSLKKGGASESQRMAKVEAELKEIRKAKEEADKEKKRIQREMEISQKEQERTKAETKKLAQRLEELQKAEKELQKEEEEKDEVEEATERAKKQLQKLDKEEVAMKDELKQLKDLKDELSKWVSQCEKLTKDHERIKNEIKTAQSNAERNSSSAPGKDDDTSTTRRRARETDREDVSSAANARAEQRQIEELQKQLKDLEREFEERKNQVEEQIADANTEQKKHEAKIARVTEEMNELKTALKKVHDLAISDEQEIEEKTNEVLKEFSQLLKEMDRVKKDLQKQEKDTGDLNNEINTQKFVHTQNTNKAVQSEYELRKYTEIEDRVASERKTIARLFADTKQDLEITSENLEKTKKVLAELQEQFKEYNLEQDKLQQKLEEELFAEVQKVEELKRTKYQREKEISKLRAHFKTSEGEAKGGSEAEGDPAAYEKWLEVTREDRMNEVKKMRDKLKSIKPKERTLQELQESFKQGLQSLAELDREELGLELEDLNVIMNDLQMPTKERFNLFVTVVEERIDPGIVRELGVLLEMQNAPEGLHPLRTANHILYLSKRDCKMDSNLKLRDVLLERLAIERHQRTRKDTELCKITILEGGDYAEDDK